MGGDFWKLPVKSSATVECWREKEKRQLSRPPVVARISPETWGRCGQACGPARCSAGAPLTAAEFEAMKPSPTAASPPGHSVAANEPGGTLLAIPETLADDYSVT